MINAQMTMDKVKDLQIELNNLSKVLFDLILLEFDYPGSLGEDDLRLFKHLTFKDNSFELQDEYESTFPSILLNYDLIKYMLFVSSVTEINDEEHEYVSHLISLSKDEIMSEFSDDDREKYFSLESRPLIFLWLIEAAVAFDKAFKFEKDNPFLDACVNVFELFFKVGQEISILSERYIKKKVNDEIISRFFAFLKEGLDDLYYNDNPFDNLNIEDYVEQEDDFESSNEELAGIKNDFVHKTLSATSNDNKGYIYVLMNASMPGLFKVGKTKNTPEERAKELSASTGVPTPFIVVYSQLVNDCGKGEKYVHEVLASKGFRISDNREFFNAPCQLIIDIILQYKNTLDCSRGEVGRLNDNSIDNPAYDEDCELPYEKELSMADEYYLGINGSIVNYDFAIEHYKKAINLGSKDAWCGLAECYKRLGDFGENKSYVKKQLNALINGTNVGSLKCLVELLVYYYIVGDDRNVIACYHKLLDFNTKEDSYADFYTSRSKDLSNGVFYVVDEWTSQGNEYIDAGTKFNVINIREAGLVDHVNDYIGACIKCGYSYEKARIEEVKEFLYKNDLLQVLKCTYYGIESDEGKRCIEEYRKNNICYKKYLSGYVGEFHEYLVKNNIIGSKDRVNPINEIRPYVEKLAEGRACFTGKRGTDSCGVNYEKAVDLFRKAIDLGSVDAWNDLALCYKDGKGVEQNSFKERGYLKRGVERGSVVCINGLIKLLVDNNEMLPAVLTYQKLLKNYTDDGYRELFVYRDENACRGYDVLSGPDKNGKCRIKLQEIFLVENLKKYIECCVKLHLDYSEARINLIKKYINILDTNYMERYKISLDRNEILNDAFIKDYSDHIKNVKYYISNYKSEFSQLIEDSTRMEPESYADTKKESDITSNIKAENGLEKDKSCNVVEEKSEMLGTLWGRCKKTFGGLFG